MMASLRSLQAVCVVVSVMLWLFASISNAFVDSVAPLPQFSSPNAFVRVSRRQRAHILKERPFQSKEEIAYCFTNKRSPSRPTSPCSTALKGTPLSAVDVRGIIGRSVTRVGAPLLRELTELTPARTALIGASFIVGFALGRVRPFWKRYQSVMDIPLSRFGPSAPALRGRAVSVTDGDTIRFLHRPTWLHPMEVNGAKKKQHGKSRTRRGAKKKKERMSDVTLAIRLCSIDTPETAKFGKSGQPFGVEAKEHLKGLLSEKTVKVRLLHRDQYGRAVGEVYTGRWPLRRYADEEMLKAGLAEVYQGSGAVYGPRGKEDYLEMESMAKKKKIGIWSLEKRESAAEYKRRTKQ